MGNELLRDLCPARAIDLCHCLSHAVALGMSLVLCALGNAVWAAAEGCGALLASGGDPWGASG